MKKIIILFLFLYGICSTQAQQTGIIPVKGPRTLVYKITDKEAGKLYRSKPEKMKESLLYHCTDTLQGIRIQLLASYPQGHYLLVTAQSNNLNFRLISVIPFAHRMINNQSDMALLVFDKQNGQAITDAKVRVGNKKLSFDPETRSYRHKKTDKQGILSIEVNGMTAYYSVNRQYDANWWKRMKAGVWNAPVVKYVSRPVLFVTSIPMDGYRSIRNKRTVGSIYSIQKPFSDIYRSISWGYPTGFVDRIAEWFEYETDISNSKGFMAFSKPMYRPGDTVRMKAFVTGKREKPLRDSLELCLNVHGKRQHIQYLKPYSPGLYTVEFVPRQSYGMRLDNTYSLQLINKKGKIVRSGPIRYEDYELKSAQYFLRTEKNNYLTHEDVVLYAKATDENDMPMMDAMLQLTLETDRVNDYPGKLVMVPKVLWKKDITLDPVGETRIVVPDSIWPKASLAIKITGRFSNSENQTDKKVLDLTLSTMTEQLIFTQHADSLNIRFEIEGHPVDGKKAIVYRGILNDSMILSLPVRIPINPLVDNYKVILEENRKVNGVYFPNAGNSGVMCSMSRLQDSVFISVSNPFNLPLVYTIYRGNKEQQRGEGELAGYRAKISNKNYYLSVQYVWGGTEQQLEYRLGHNDTPLKISTSLPAIIYPGQSVAVNIVTTDQHGNPVPAVDLTAWGYTAKFGTQYIPPMPYIPVKATRKAHNAFSSGFISGKQRNTILDYPKWSGPMKLDSLEMYRFAYPGKEVYRYSFPSADGQTYISPYLVHDGKLLPVNILYINDRPVYFNQTTTDAPYVFPVTGNQPVIRIRTPEFEVHTRIHITPGHKNMLSIDPCQWDRSSGLVKKRKEEYNASEQNLMRQYLMPVRYKSSGRMAYLRQGDHFELLNNDQSRWYSIHTTGPFVNTPVTLWEEDRKIITFERDPSDWFEYEPLPGMLKMRTVRFDSGLRKSPPPFQWLAAPYTWSYIDSIAGSMKISRIRQSAGTRTSPSWRGGPLTVSTELDPYIQAKGWCWMLYSYTYKDVLFYPLSERSFRTISDGTYALILLMADKSFYLQDSIAIKQDTTLMMRLNVRDMAYPAQPVDSFFSSHPTIVDISNYSGLDIKTSAFAATSSVQVHGEKQYVNGRVHVCGRVTDATGEPVTGAMIVVKGTTIGVVTDIDGNYCIDVPDSNPILQASFIGYVSVDSPPLDNGIVDFILSEDAMLLDEVVVVGYGTQKKVHLTGSVATLSGHLAGVQIRGVGSVRDGSQPLYVVDGVVVTDISSIPAGNIGQIEVLKEASATALYGSRAANGVVIITTGTGIKKPAVTDAADILQMAMDDEAFMAGAGTSKGLRTNFSDEAFWQPSLTTDHQGRASFRTTFPDDITKWNINLIGLVPGKLSAAHQVQVRSFKPLTGQLALPRFIVEGDTARVIGKVTNYSSDTIRISTRFSVDDIQQTDHQATVRHSLVDTLAVTAPLIHETGSDSISIQYQLVKDDGYMDGEKRYIPVIRQGTTEHIGQFHVLDTDTTITLSMDPAKGPVTLSMESTAIDILLAETRYLRDYRHLCNEQSASRLKALLLEKKAYTFMGKDYPYDKHIRSLISRVIKGQNSSGMWGWFGNEKAETWISTHAAEALLDARENGFDVDMVFSTLADQLIWSYDRTNDADRIRILNLLMRINPQSDYHAMFRKINEKQFLYYTDYLKWMELAIRFGKNVDEEIRELLDKKHTDKPGNVYWTEDKDKPYWMYNNTAVTLAAYRVLRESGHTRLLPQIRNYLYYQRSGNRWLNTYESAGILSTIMPDLIKTGSLPGYPQVRIEGKQSFTVDSFPKQITLTGHEPVSITRSGTFPVYITASQEVYNPVPDPVDEGFRVTTRFPGINGAQLSAGKSVSLEATVQCAVSSEYVMIEIPIPAGCSYQRKSQSWYRESHREYFKDRVCIYLRHMPEGSHTFTIELMPRYTGHYHINPAKAERMYMPLFYGRTGVEKIKIVN